MLSWHCDIRPACLFQLSISLSNENIMDPLNITFPFIWNPKVCFEINLIYKMFKVSIFSLIYCFQQCFIMIDFVTDISFAGHGNFVSSICVVPANKQCDQPLVATGCTDSSIRLFAFGQKQPVAQLIGHSSNVSSLRAGSRGIILSGSWDSTVKQWLNHSCVQTMAGMATKI